MREDSYIEVQSVRPSIRIGPDGFVLHETVAEYIQILTLWTGELKTVSQDQRRPRKFRATAGFESSAGASLIFNEYGQLKYHIPDRLEDLGAGPPSRKAEMPGGERLL